MNRQQVDAVAYCRAIGADPYEQVYGWLDGVVLCMSRWQWYIGAEMPPCP